MGQLVVTCHPDGAVETLLKDEIFDTRKMADKRKIERVSEIIPTDDGQKFMVRWLKGPLVGSRHYIFDNGAEFQTTTSISCDTIGQAFYFDSYRDAVDYEVATVNLFRLNGHSFVA